MISRPLGELADSMGIRLIEASAERTVATMPVLGNRQPLGLLHGGATALIAETVGSVAAHLSAGPGRFAVGIELNISHHRSATDGTVTATATAVQLGKTLATYSIEVLDAEGRRISTARLTCLLRDEQQRPTPVGTTPL
jgi:1,4-dihydroxy-2-naphthoyl-CoA hydrolase